MRYMDGGDLSARLKEGPLSIPETASLIERIGAALDQAHKQGVIHRDLKPGNILFDQYNHPFLSDFGIARLLESSQTLTNAGGIIGTPAYMSPEQVRGNVKVDHRSDIYALGCIVFEALTGQTPYKAKTPAKLMMKHVLSPVPRILKVKSDLPPGSETIISRAMAKDKEQRYSTANDLAVDLAKVLQDFSASAAPSPSQTAFETILSSPDVSRFGEQTERDVPNQEFTASAAPALSQTEFATMLSSPNVSRFGEQTERDVPPLATTQSQPASRRLMGGKIYLVGGGLLLLMISFGAVILSSLNGSTIDPTLAQEVASELTGEGTIESTSDQGDGAEAVVSLQDTPTVTPQPSDTLTPVPTSTPQPPTHTPIPTNTPTFTPQPTSTPTFTPQPTITPTVTPQPTSTSTSTSTAVPTTTPLPLPTPTPVRPRCPNPNARITSPSMNARLEGIAPIRGTANIENFAFYKIQFIPEADLDTEAWSELYQNDQPAVNEILMEWHTNTVPPGPYWLRLIVERFDGQYPEPCQIRVIIP